MRKLASIQVIQAVEPIENADAIERVKILGWWVVVKKGELKVGDKVVYCEIDSYFPIRPEFEFLRPSSYRKAIVEGGMELMREGFRIRTVKLRGQVSQGICFPMSILPEGGPYEIGDDVTIFLGIEKYEPPIPACLTGVVKGLFPNYIPKTDEIRVQNLEDLIVRHKGKTFFYTEKLDGASATIFLHENDFGICTRSLWLDEERNEDNSVIKMVKELGVFNRLREIHKATGFWYAIQGEMVGPGIQKNRYALSKPKFFGFNVVIINDGRRLMERENAILFMTELGLDVVPTLGSITLDHTVDQLVELSKGKSLLNSKVHREGLVFRPAVEENDFAIGRLSFKAINPEFLLKYDE